MLMVGGGNGHEHLSCVMLMVGEDLRCHEPLSRLTLMIGGGDLRSVQTLTKAVCRHAAEAESFVVVVVVVVVIFVLLRHVYPCLPALTL